jgi:hypothetical protein
VTTSKLMYNAFMHDPSKLVYTVFMQGSCKHMRKTGSLGYWLVQRVRTW